jgi:hypothetical protein
VTDDASVQFAPLALGVVRPSGFAKDFDALDGRPLSNPTHTWTASSFLVLASRHLTAGEDGSA